MNLPAKDPRHGTANGYNNLRCRCDACREAWTIYIRTHRSIVVSRPKCVECKRRYPLRLSRVYAIRSGCGKSTNYCGRKCAGRAMARRHGHDPDQRTCEAPVPGGCPLPKISGRAGNCGLCQGHNKRRDRGLPIDTPINLRISSINRAARRRALAEKAEVVS